MKQSTSKQRQIMHSLMRNIGLDDDAMKDMKLNATGGRTESSKEMTFAEADALIKNLGAASINRNNAVHVSMDKMRKNIIRMAHLLGWQYNNGKANMKRIDAWCKSYGQYKKPLMDHTYNELVNLVTQFKKMYLSELKRA